MKINSFIILIVFALLSCHSNAEEKFHETKEFKDYWYSGKAEITSYKLTQERYGQLHDGYAVLVFVTEDLSREKQVKLDNPSDAGDDAVKVMKLNLVKKFNTGIYRYSIMESVFTPLFADRDPNTLKLTMSAQEWCGHVFTQVNLLDDRYRVRSYSYFESEGDRDFSLEKAFLEDEIWNRIRLNPDALPTGEIRIIPGLTISRLKHQNPEIKTAVASLSRDEDTADKMIYSLKFPDTGRNLQIVFEKDFPHKIDSWKETFKNGSGNEQVTEAVAVKMESVHTDYWNKNSIKDEVLRERLGIE